MVNRARDKGTLAETAVAEYLCTNGWPSAERRRLAGAKDKGDITGTPGIAWEVKYAGTGLRMGEWMAQTVKERDHANARYGVLVIKPAGRGLRTVDRWFAVMLGGDFESARLATEPMLDSTRIVVRPPAGYSASKLGDQLFAVNNTKRANEIPVLTLRPRGLADQPAQYYHVLYFAHAVQLLRLAGYGDPWNHSS